MASAFLAVASVATAAPLNPGYRAPQLDFYLADLDAKLLLTTDEPDDAVMAVAESRGVPVVRIAANAGGSAGCFDLRSDRIGAADSNRGLQQAFTPAGDGDIALVLHTSGTTSRPKIVPLTHANLCASADNIARTLRLTPEDVCLNVMPLFHIHGLVAATLASLSRGASICCTRGFIATEFFSWLDAVRPTWYTAVPTMHQSIVERAGPHAEVIDRLAGHLRFIRSSSSALAPQLAEQIESLFGVPTVEAYGMTEAAHQMCCNPLPPAPRKFGSVGPAAGPEVAIMNESGRLLASGETGEIVIRGKNVFSGYAANPQANAEAFTDGWFRTGDEGHLDEDGYLYLTGRIKEIIIRGGENISPRQIDEVLLDHPGIRQAVAFGIPDKKLGEEVGVAVVAGTGSSLTEHDVRAFAAERLPDFKVPRRVVIVDEIPKGATGKLQRIGLAQKLGILSAREDEEHGGVEHVEPRTDTERALADIWRQTLKIDHVGALDHFFDLGGDSVLAAAALNRIGQRLGVELKMLVFFESPILEAMAAAIDRAIADTQPTSNDDLVTTLAAMDPQEAQRLLDAAEHSAVADSAGGPPETTEKAPTVIARHWNSIADQWRHFGPPLRPCEEDLAVYEANVAKWRARTDGHGAPAAALLGVTPEIATMHWPAGTTIDAVERSDAMIATVWPGDTDSHRPVQRRAHHGDWLSLPFDDRTKDVVIGDGCFISMSFPAGYAELVAEARRVLREDGVMIMRFFVTPVQTESPDDVFADLDAGRIGSFHVFKWRLTMAVQDRPTDGVCLDDVWRCWADRSIDVNDLAAKTGWSDESIRTIELYCGKRVRFSYPTLDAVIQSVDGCLTPEAIHTPGYELGERCPIVTMRPIPAC